MMYDTEQNFTILRLLLISRAPEECKIWDKLPRQLWWGENSPSFLGPFQSVCTCVSIARERRGLGNVITCFLHTLGSVLWFFQCIVQRLCRKGTGLEPRLTLLQILDLQGTCASRVVESQILLEVALCRCPQNSPTLPQEHCLQFAPWRWQLETLGKVGCEKCF